jgi:hypothetical protein
MKSLSHTPSKNARPAISGECVACALAPELLSPPPIVVGPFRILLSLCVLAFYFWWRVRGPAFYTHTHKYLPIWEEKMFGIAQWRNKSSRSFWHFTEETNSPLLGFFPPHSFLRVCIDWSGHLILSRLSFLFRGCKRNATSDGQRDGCRYLFDSRVFSLNQKGGAKKKRPMAKRDKDRPPLDTTTTAAATTRVLVLLSADIYAYIHVKQSPRWYAGPKAPVIWYNLWRLHRLCSSAGRASLSCVGETASGTNVPLRRKKRLDTVGVPTTTTTTTTGGRWGGYGYDCPNPCEWGRRRRWTGYAHNRFNVTN